jgi:hypothetical protein
MTNSNWTLRFPRTTRCDGHAIYYYKTPLSKRLFYALIRHGWWLAFLAAILLTGCVDMESEQRSADSLRDAVAQAKEPTWAISQK